MIVEWYCPPLWLRHHIGLWLWSHMSSTLFVEPYWFLYSKFNFDQINYNCGTILVPQSSTMIMEPYWFLRLPGVCLQYSTMIVEPYWFLSPPLWLWNLIGSSVFQGYACSTQLWLWNHISSSILCYDLWNYIGSSILHYDCGTILVSQSSTMFVEPYCPPLWLWHHFVLHYDYGPPLWFGTILWLWIHFVFHYDCGTILALKSSTMIAELYCLPLRLWNYFVLNYNCEPYWFLSPPSMIYWTILSWAMM